MEKRLPIPGRMMVAREMPDDAALPFRYTAPYYYLAGAAFKLLGQDIVCSAARHRRPCDATERVTSLKRPYAGKVFFQTTATLTVAGQQVAQWQRRCGRCRR